MEKKSYVAAVDLGSTRVTVAIGSINPDDGTLSVEGLVDKPVEGVSAGNIENIQSVRETIAAAVGELEEQTGLHIEEAYVGVSGDSVCCANHTDHVFASDSPNGINQKDVNALYERMNNVQVAKPDDERILERYPQSYQVDDRKNVEKPVGMFGRKLSSTFNFILCQRTPMQRLEMALKGSNIRVQGYFANVMAFPEAVLSEDEKAGGVVAVDIGADLIDVAVWYRNIARYVVVIPIGASAIDNDILSMGIPERLVKPLKRRYGSAVPELVDEGMGVKIPTLTARKTERAVSLRNLAKVIEARTGEFIEYIKDEIRNSGCAEQLRFGIVVTGGSANLKEIDELFRRKTQMETRIGYPEFGFDEASVEKYTDPAYAAVMGLLLRGMKAGASSVIVVNPAARQPQPAPVATPEAQTAPAAPAASTVQQPAQRPAQPVQTPAAQMNPPQYKGYATPAVPQPQTPPEQPGAAPAAEPAPAPVQPGRRDPEDFADDFEQEKPKPGRLNIGKFLDRLGAKITKSFEGGDDEEL